MEQASVDGQSVGNAGLQQPKEKDISLQAVSGSFTGVTQHTVEVRQEDARTAIALTIAGSLAFIVLATFVTLWSHTIKFKSVDDIVKLVQAVLSPVVGIVGAVTGFYFGARQGQRPPDNTTK
jgi:hypothetical protein